MNCRACSLPGKIKDGYLNTMWGDVVHKDCMNYYNMKYGGESSQFESIAHMMQCVKHADIISFEDMFLEALLKYYTYVIKE